MQRGSSRQPVLQQPAQARRAVVRRAAAVAWGPTRGAPPAPHQPKHASLRTPPLLQLHLPADQDQAAQLKQRGEHRVAARQQMLL